MRKLSGLSKHGVRYIGRMFLQLFFQIGIIWIAAGTLTVGVQMIVYFTTLAVSYVVELWTIASRNPEVLNERVKNIQTGTKSWDKVLLSLYVAFAYIIMNIFIGLDVRHEWPHIDFAYCWIGLVLYIISISISMKALLENKYFESSSRIQKERNQTVVSTGVYSFVRHPGYSAILIWALSIPLLTGAIFASVPSVIIIVIILIRTYLEDGMLKKELHGYQEYSEKTKCRLIPYIW